MDTAASSYSFYKSEIKNWASCNFNENCRILDVGAGSGTYYNLLHDTFKNIDCVEIYKPNITDYNLNEKYVNVFNENIVNFKYDYYDLIIFGDVLEHLDVKEAQKVLKYAYNRCKNFIIAVPYCLPSNECENKYEKHIQDDLTHENIKERYPDLKLLFGNEYYGYYIKNDVVSKRKYSVLTFNFGDYEVMHEIEHPDENVEYIYVTDNSKLQSSTWKVIVDDSLKNMSILDKCMYVKYHPFKYCNTDICITINSNIVVKSSLDKIVKKFNNDGYDFGTLINPYRDNYVAEYNDLVHSGKYDLQQGNKCANYLYHFGFDYENYKFLVDNKLTISRRNKTVDDINNFTYATLKYLGNYNEIEKVDRTVLSSVLATHFSDLKFMPLSQLIIYSKMLCQYKHGTNTPTYTDKFTPSEEEQSGFYKGYVFNELKELITDF